MKTTAEIRQTLKKNHIKLETFQQRLHRGWSYDRAISTPTECPQGDIYRIYHDDKLVKKVQGSVAVARFLSRELRYNISKNSVVGRLYRKPSTSYGRYTVERQVK